MVWVGIPGMGSQEPLLAIDIGGAKEPGMSIIPMKKGAKEPRGPQNHCLEGRGT